MAEIKKVIIEVGGKKMEFTPAEAKELKAILSDLFGGDKVVERIVERRQYPWHYWQPYIYCEDNKTTYISGGTAPNTTTGQSWSVSEPVTSGYISICAVGA